MGWWKRLDPKQKKLYAAAGIGGLVLLVLMLSRRQNAENTAADSTDTSTAYPTTATNPLGGGADPGSGLGAIPDYSSELGALAGGLSSQQDAIDQLTLALKDQPGLIAASIGATTQTPAAAPVAQPITAAAAKATAKAPAHVLSGGVRYAIDPKTGKRTVDPSKAHPATKPKATKAKAAPPAHVMSGGVRYAVNPKTGKRTVDPSKAHPATKPKVPQSKSHAPVHHTPSQHPSTRKKKK